MNIVQGSGVDTDLNAAGLEQARRFYQHYRDHPFQKIYISDLKRTQQTVQRFIDDGIPFTKLPELNEISWGEFEGKKQSEEERKLYHEIVGKWNAGDHHAKLVKGESPYEMRARQQRAMEHIMGNPNEQQVLICMHGRAMKSFMCLLLDEPLSKMEQYQHSNLCLYVVKSVNGKFELVTHCDVEHLS